MKNKRKPSKPHHSIKVGNYIRRRKRYSPENVFAHLDDFRMEERKAIAQGDVDNLPTHFQLDGDFIKGNNKNRYKTFQNNLTCVGCGLEGEYFFKERYKDSNSNIWHLNLYGVKNGKEILFTKDHIIPKSKGGLNTMSNLQTMCYGCNHEKGSVSNERFMKRVGRPVGGAKVEESMQEQRNDWCDINVPRKINGPVQGQPKYYPDDTYGPGTLPVPPIIVDVPQEAYDGIIFDDGLDNVELTNSQQDLSKVMTNSDLLKKTLTNEEKSGKVLCIDCKHFSKNNTKCAYERVVEVDYILGVKRIEAVDCYIMNKDGNCPHFDI